MIPQSAHELSVIQQVSANVGWRLLPKVHTQSYSQVLWIKAILSQLGTDCFAGSWYAQPVWPFMGIVFADALMAAENNDLLHFVVRKDLPAIAVFRGWR